MKGSLRLLVDPYHRIQRPGRRRRRRRRRREEEEEEEEDNTC